MKRKKLLNKKKNFKDVDEIISVLLKNRGIRREAEKEEFFNPTLPQNLTAQDLGIDAKSLVKAVRRIKHAIKKKERIVVYGDYDVDGICGTALLWETLHILGAHALPYLPDRFTEGYGLNIEAIKFLKEKDPELSLIITVDHGITAHEKIDFAKELGIDVIVTDHHEKAEVMPPSHSLVHTTAVSGAAVAWILSRELAGSDDLTNDHLGLVALGTIADVLPLLGPNRSIAMHGLKVLRESNRPGLVALCREAGIKKEELNTFHIGFVLGPRLNAMGRVENALDSLRLLCTRSRGRAQELALKLGRTNKIRQEKTEYAVSHIQEVHSGDWENGKLPKLLFVHHDSYEEGVIGVVAGRLVEKYNRPAIVVSRGEEVSKASARSITGVNIVEMIRKAGDKFFVSVGGHPMAAGFTTKTEQLSVLEKKLVEIGDQEVLEDFLVRNIKVDCEINFSDITRPLYKKLSSFAPFGLGNPEPTFLTRRVYAKEARLVGKDSSHLKLWLEKAGKVISGIAFRMGELYPSLSPEKPLDLVYSIEEDEWGGNKKLQLKVRDISGYD